LQKNMSTDSFPVDMWQPDEVGTWLQRIKLPQYRERFIQEEITGMDLIDLTEADLLELGVVSVGHRKLLLRNVSKLTGAIMNDGSDDDTSVSSHDSSMMSFDSGNSARSEQYSSSSYSKEPEKRITCMCRYRRDVRIILLKPKTSLKKLQWKIQDEYNRKFDLYWNSDGDKIRLGSDRQLRTAIKLLKPDEKLTISLRKRSKKKKHSSRSSSRSTSRSTKSSKSRKRTGTTKKNVSASADGIIEACVVVGTDGYISSFNQAAERLFGYDKDEVIGKNVSVLMPSVYGARHDGYMKRYLQTGIPKIVNTSRAVLGKHKNGALFNVELGVTESKVGDTVSFIGIFKEAENAGSGLASAEGTRQEQHSIVDNLLESVICIDENSVIIHANPNALKFFGYEAEELIGKNLNILMPSPHRENHGHYVRKFLKTGLSSVMNKSRNTICELSDGNIVPITLSVSETAPFGTTRQFIASVTPRARNTKSASFLQQQRQVIESITSAAVIIDSFGTIQGFNKAACKLLGFKLESVLGQNVQMIVGLEHAANHQQYIENYLASGVAKIIGKERNVKARQSSGQEILVQLSVTEHRSSDGKILFIGLLFAV